MKKYQRQISVIAMTTVLSVAGLWYFASTRTPVSAVSSVATMIGGKSNGYSDTCCTGFIIDFEAVDSSQPLILNDEAMYQPGFSTSYSYYTETSGGGCALGTLKGQGYCLDPGEECESGSFYPLINTVGTSQTGCEYSGTGSGSSGSSGGGSGFGGGSFGGGSSSSSSGSSSNPFEGFGDYDFSPGAMPIQVQEAQRRLEYIQGLLGGSSSDEE